MSVVLQNVTHTCFGLSYLLAFLLEVAGTRWPLRSLRWTGLILGTIGLFTHTVFLAVHHPTPATAYGALLALAWVLAVFYLYGALHHRRMAWAVFVLPIVIALVGLSFFLVAGTSESGTVAAPLWMASGQRFWGGLHGVFLLLAAVGISVGCVASVMYLLQADRLRRKLNPLGGMKLLNLERLEQMNRRAVNLAFPFLTVGLLLGAVLLRHYEDFASRVLSAKILGTMGLWLVFLVLLYLRYAAHVPGRRLAWYTMAAFLVMLGVLLASHPFATGEPPRESPPVTEVSP